MNLNKLLYKSFHTFRMIDKLVNLIIIREWLAYNIYHYPDSKDHGGNMGPTWVLSAPGGAYVGPKNLVIRVEQPAGWSNCRSEMSPVRVLPHSAPLISIVGETSLSPIKERTKKQLTNFIVFYPYLSCQRSGHAEVPAHCGLSIHINNDVNNQIAWTIHNK